MNETDILIEQETSLTEQEECAIRTLIEATTKVLKEDGSTKALEEDGATKALEGNGAVTSVMMRDEIIKELKSIKTDQEEYMKGLNGENLEKTKQTIMSQLDEIKRKSAEEKSAEDLMAEIPVKTSIYTVNLIKYCGINGIEKIKEENINDFLKYERKRVEKIKIFYRDTLTKTTESNHLSDAHQEIFYRDTPIETTDLSHETKDLSPKTTDLSPETTNSPGEDKIVVQVVEASNVKAKGYPLQDNLRNQIKQNKEKKDNTFAYLLHSTSDLKKRREASHWSLVIQKGSDVVVLDSVGADISPANKIFKDFIAPTEANDKTIKYKRSAMRTQFQTNGDCESLSRLLLTSLIREMVFNVNTNENNENTNVNTNENTNKVKNSLLDQFQPYFKKVGDNDFEYKISSGGKLVSLINTDPETGIDLDGKTVNLESKEFAPPYYSLITFSPQIYNMLDEQHMDFVGAAPQFMTGSESRINNIKEIQDSLEANPLFFSSKTTFNQLAIASFDLQIKAIKLYQETYKQVAKDENKIDEIFQNLLKDKELITKLITDKKLLITDETLTEDEKYEKISEVLSNEESQKSILNLEVKTVGVLSEKGVGTVKRFIGKEMAKRGAINYIMPCQSGKYQSPKFGTALLTEISHRELQQPVIQAFVDLDQNLTFSPILIPNYRKALENKHEEKEKMASIVRSELEQQTTSLRPLSQVTTCTGDGQCGIVSGLAQQSKFAVRK